MFYKGVRRFRSTEVLLHYLGDFVPKMNVLFHNIARKPLWLKPGIKPGIFWYKTVNSSVSMIRKEKIRSSRTRVASTLFYTKRSRVSRVRAVTDTGEEKRTGVVPTLEN